jgi:5'-nucleotidase
LDNRVERPLIVITNDDGIHSAGLRAAVESLAPLGELLVVAPDRQWSGAGRSMPLSVTSSVEVVAYPHPVDGEIRAYAVDATPAICVVYAMLELVNRQPAIVVSGINFGENVSTEITISGTVGAALEAATFHVPALAVSLEMAVENHLNGDALENYAAAKAYTYRFAKLLIERMMPFDVDVLSINLPRTATVNTPWQLTRISRHRYFVPTPAAGIDGNHRPGYRLMDNPQNAEIGSDVWCLHSAQQVSVTPLSLDLTSRVAFGELDEVLRRETTT